MGLDVNMHYLNPRTELNPGESLLQPRSFRTFPSCSGEHKSAPHHHGFDFLTEQKATQLRGSVLIIFFLQIILCVSSKQAAFPTAKRTEQNQFWNAKEGFLQALDHGLSPKPRKSSADPEWFPPALRTLVDFRAQAEHMLSLMALNKPG